MYKNSLIEAEMFTKYLKNTRPPTSTCQEDISIEAQMFGNISIEL